MTSVVWGNSKFRVTALKMSYVR